MAARNPDPRGGPRAAALAPPAGAVVWADDVVLHLPEAEEPLPPGRTSAAPMGALLDGPLRALFLDLVGRPPLEPERSAWLGRAAGELVDTLVGTRSFWAHWLDEQLFYFLLIDNFSPVGDDVRALPDLLAEGRLSARDAIHRIALTPTFDLRNPGADTFVTVVMEQVCGMTVQDSRRELEIGKTVYDGRPGRFLGTQADSQADVVRVAVEHRRAARHLVEREYERLVRAPRERRDVVRDGRRFAKDPWCFPELVREWLASVAYADRLARGAPLSNRLFVRALFVDLLGRVPTPEEAEPLRNALDGLGDPRPLRGVVAKMLLDSGRAPVPREPEIDDPTAWIADLFRRLLGREASEDELRTFVTTFHEPDCEPATVLYALVSHAEYHTY